MPSADEHKAKRTQPPNWVDILTLVVLIFTMGGIFWYTSEASRQTKLTQRALKVNARLAKAAEQANEIARTSSQGSDQFSKDSLKFTRQGLELSRQSLIASQRAWLIPKDIKITIKDDGSLHIELLVANVGKNPARDIRGVTQFSEESTPEQLATLEKIMTHIYPYTFVGPGVDHTFFFDSEPVSIAQRNTNLAIKGGKLKARLYGKIIYSDDFVPNQVLPLCALYTTESGYHACPSEYTTKK